jgi:hypothetical protein
MIDRTDTHALLDLLKSFPAVALLGPRQVGKTTLALELAEGMDALYLDLESEADKAKLSTAELFLGEHQDRLVILDEVHRLPDIFQPLRSLIDTGRRNGRKAGRYLLLGSASMDLLKQSGETLAGRIAYLELQPFNLLEAAPHNMDALWLRGGFPDSFLADSDARSMQWRRNFIRTYLERDIPQFGPRIPAETLRRFWTMLAHAQGGLFNASQFARGLGVTGKTVSGYLDLLVDLLLVRRLPPMHRNVGKRLVKSPKVFVRDSGLVHTLLGIGNADALLGHPVVGLSWEGFCIENLMAVAPEDTGACFYRTAAGAEIDLLLELPGNRRWAVEFKLGLAPRLEKGFYHARETVAPEKSFVVYSGKDRYPLAEGVEAIGLHGLMQELRTQDR